MNIDCRVIGDLLPLYAATLLFHSQQPLGLQLGGGGYAEVRFQLFGIVPIVFQRLFRLPPQGQSMHIKDAKILVHRLQGNYIGA